MCDNFLIREEVERAAFWAHCLGVGDQRESRRHPRLALMGSVDSQWDVDSQGDVEFPVIQRCSKEIRMVQ